MGVRGFRRQPGRHLRLIDLSSDAMRGEARHPFPHLSMHPAGFLNSATIPRGRPAFGDDAYYDRYGMPLLCSIQ